MIATTWRQWSLAGMLIVMAHQACAQTGTPIITSTPTVGYSFYDAAGRGGAANVISVSGGPGFTQAIRVNYNSDAPNIYDSALSWTNTASIAAGDLIQITYYIRKVSPLDNQPVRGQFVMERNGSPYTQSLTAGYPASTNGWTRYSYACKSAEAYAVGGCAFRFQCARGPQQFDIGGITCVKYPTGTSVTSLDLAYPYPGSELDAPWRTEANARIETYRKADFKVTVLDKDGLPVPNANVGIAMTNHAFRFGSAVVGSRLTASDSTNATYRSKFQSLFNAAVLENDLKWPFVETWSASSAVSGMNWLTSRGYPVRGHNVIWPSWGNMPPDCQGLATNDLRTRIDNRVFTALQQFPGKLYDWDVLNEPYDNNDVQGRIPGVSGVSSFTGRLGNAEMVRWFQEARAADPTAHLFLNDYNVIEGEDTSHRAYTMAVLNYLIGQGAPIDAFGMQSHFKYNMTSMETYKSRIDAIAALGLRLAVTEFDADVIDESLQANFLRDYMTLIFSTPKADSFFVWGFWEGAHWLPQAAMLRSDFSEKAAAAMWRDLVFNQWWTDVHQATVSTGITTVRGFLGSYSVQVNALGTVKTVSSSLASGGQNLVVSLPVALPSLALTVDLQDLSIPPTGEVVDVELRTPGTQTVVASGTCTLNPSGAGKFMIPTTLGAGTYDIAVQGRHWLRKKLSSQSLPANGSKAIAVSLVNGDVDGDNAVTVFDYGALSDAFDTSVGDPSWNPAADLDGDGAITVFDYGILSTNFDRSGDD